jgi:predicted flap endonuclease-1-like 5' DNA nuclease
LFTTYQSNFHHPMTPLTRTTAELEILILMAGSFLLGYLFYHCVYGRSTNKKGGCCGGRPIPMDRPNTPPLSHTPMSTPTTPPLAHTVPLAAVAPAPVHTPLASTRDDLKVIEGIGPTIEKIFNAQGVQTFATLASLSSEKIHAMLDEAGPRFRMHDGSTWAEQAALLRDGEYEAFAALKESLKGGKRS